MSDVVERRSWGSTIPIETHTVPELAPEVEPIVVRDVHPAAVTLTGEFGEGGQAQWAKARVLLTQERLYVYVEESRVPTLAYSAPFQRDGLVLPPAGASQGKAWRVPTDEGMVIVQPSGGCGCGSVLKLFAPFQPMRRGAL